MRKYTFSEIKLEAKSAMAGHIGEVILAGLILPIALNLIASSLNELFVFIHLLAPMLLSTFTSAISTYIVLRMVIKISRFKSDKIFEKFLGTKKGITNSLLWGLLMIVVTGVYVILFWDHVVMLWDIIAFITSDAFAQDPESFDGFIGEYVISDPSMTTIYISIIYSIFLVFISIRIGFTQMIIADRDEDFISAIKTSWKITKGNWWRIFLFPLSFILWLLLTMITLGIASIYVVPYMAVAQASLYNHLLKESGIEFDDGITDENKNSGSMVDENALDEEKNQFDKPDPFEDYYN